MKKLLYPLCALFLLLSCSKNSQQSKAALLAAGNWKIIADSISPGISFSGPIETDMYPHYSPCERDDYFSFKSNGAYELNNGAQKCNPADLQKVEGTWFFSDGDTKLNFSPDPGYLAEQCDILELSSSKMRLVWYTRQSNGTIYRSHFITLRH